MSLRDRLCTKSTLRIRPHVCAAGSWPLTGDFPDMDRFRERLRGWDLDKLPKLDTKALRSVEKTLTVRIPSLMQRFENPYVAA